MSRMTTSSASFSWARAAMRRACSSGVRAGSVSWRGIGRSVAANGGRQSAAVEAALLDQRRDRGRDEPVERLARGGEAADVARGGRVRLDVEEEDALRLRAASRAPRRAAARGKPGRVATASRVALEHRVRLLPRREVAELVGADHEQRVVEGLGAEQVDRARVRVEPHVLVREGRARELEPRLGRRLDALVAGSGGDEDDEPRRARTSASRPRATATWPRCGGSNAPPKSPSRATRAPRRRARPRRPRARRRP